MKIIQYCGKMQGEFLNKVFTGAVTGALFP